MPAGTRLLAPVMMAAAAVKAPGAQAARLEPGVRSRMGTDRCARASRRAPCRRARGGRRAAPGSPTDNPRLRLRVISKARQIVELAVAWHVTSPWLVATTGQRDRIRTCHLLFTRQGLCAMSY